MKFVETRPFADPEVAAWKLLETANSIEAVQDGRIHIEKINWPFLSEFKGSSVAHPARCRQPDHCATHRPSQSLSIGKPQLPALSPRPRSAES
jgi:hypothetical protein